MINYIQDCIGKKYAPRQLLLHCSNKLHPCSDAFFALSPSMVVVHHLRLDDIQEVLVSGEGRMPVATAHDCMDAGGRATQEAKVGEQRIIIGWNK